MKVKRAIEIYRKLDDENIDTFCIDATVGELTSLLYDLEIYPDDRIDELYMCYFLTEDQLNRLKNTFSDLNFHIDTDAYIYELNCYSISNSN